MLGVIIYVCIVFGIIRFIMWSREQAPVVKFCEGQHKWEYEDGVGHTCSVCKFKAGSWESENGKY